VFRIEDSVCSLTEIMVYLVNTKDGYEASFGSEIWSAKTDSGTVEERLKESVLAKVAQIKVMNLLAAENEIVLDEEENEIISAAATEYYDGLTDAEKAAMNNVTYEDIVQIYTEQAIANKFYDYLIKDINPEISDDEARTITVEQILIKTYTLDAGGNRTSFSDEKKRVALSTAREVMIRLGEGRSFDELMAEYNEADEDIISFGKGEMEDAYEEAAFNLGNDEVSGIVETSDGYVILKCVSTFDREQTEANKLRIVAQRKREVFGAQYDAFVSTLTKDLNEKLWEKISLVNDENVRTSDLMEVYDRYFEK
jgi:foldase protein PrsA